MKRINRTFIKPVEERNDVIERWNPRYRTKDLYDALYILEKERQEQYARVATEPGDRCYRRISQFPAESDNFLSATRSSHAARNFSRDRPTDWSNLRYGRELKLKRKIQEMCVYGTIKGKHRKTEEM